jgi:hypothetical protein
VATAGAGTGPLRGQRRATEFRLGVLSGGWHHPCRDRRADQQAEREHGNGDGCPHRPTELAVIVSGHGVLQAAPGGSKCDNCGRGTVKPPACFPLGWRARDWPWGGYRSARLDRFRMPLKGATTDDLFRGGELLEPSEHAAHLRRFPCATTGRCWNTSRIEGPCDAME